MKHLVIFFMMLLFILPTSTVWSKSLKNNRQPSTWAKPISTNLLDNFHQVSSVIFRSAQPETKSIPILKYFGIGSLLSLRTFHTNSSGFSEFIKYEVPVNQLHIDDHDIIVALQILASTKQPILVHCMQGSDRTGVVIAMYRVICQNWSKNQAIDEMVNGDFGFNPFLINLVDIIEDARVSTYRNYVKGTNCPYSP